MTMFFARSGGWEGCGITKSRALAGLASGKKDNNRVSDMQTVTLIEFYPENFFGEQTDWHNPENWAKNITKIDISKTGIHALADSHKNMETEGDITTGTEDWRIDYGDDDITYVIRSDNGIVGMDEYWDEAKKSLEDVNSWNDGEEYYIDEVEGDVELTLSEVDTR